MGKAPLTEVYINEYDNAERLIKTTHSLNGAAPITLAENTYDEMGRLQSKIQHEGVETTNYAYNVRGWMKSMTSKRFSESLYYNDSSNGSIPCYNGNIGAMNWQLQNDTPRGYNFFYDDLSRITAADYQNNDPTIDKNYSTSYTYDKMGNIKTLKRYGLLSKPSTFQAIDDLTLNYNGNQLTTIADAVNPGPLYTGAFNFVDSISNKIEYKYDANGNLTEDLNKKIAKIQYNLLNLPSMLQFTEGHTTTYLYDAAGVKRRVKQVTTTENLLVPMGSTLPVPTDKIAVSTQTDYCGNVIYENGILSRILVDDGYITMNGTTPTYHYYIQDHQGNNRVVFNQNGTIEQTNHYYPFGMTFGEGIDNSDNRYKYNGKELDRMHGLDLYDYGARHYDAAIGRWGVIDPLAEKYYSISPYAYCAGNPIRFIDSDGRKIVVPNNKDQKAVAEMINSRAEGTFEINKKSELSVNNRDGSEGYSKYYADRLIEAIDDQTHTITIKIQQTVIINGVKYDVDKKFGGGGTLGEVGKDQLIIISGHKNGKVKDVKGKRLHDKPADILGHELVGHGIPNTVGTDTGNAVSNENKVRAQLKKGMNKQRAAEPKHVE